MSEENQQSADQREYTPEEMAKMRTKMTAFYKEENKHLQPQATYYRLLAEIEENKVRRYSAMAQGAHMYAQAEQAEAEAKAAQAEADKVVKTEKPIAPKKTAKKSRTLKKD